MECEIELLRRRALERIFATLVPVAVVGLSMTGTRHATAASKAAKQDFSYQDHPKQGKSCSNCRMFIAASGGTSQCAIIAGEISPNGWCMAYTSLTG